MVDETILGRGVLRLQCAEQCLLCAEDLHGGCGVLGQTHERAGVGDEARSDELADHDGEVGCDGIHAIAQVLVQRCAVLADANDLFAQLSNVVHVLLGDLRAHRHLGGLLQLTLHVLAQDVTEIGVLRVLTDGHLADDLKKKKEKE